MSTMKPSGGKVTVYSKVPRPVVPNPRLPMDLESGETSIAAGGRSRGLRVL